MSLSDWGRHISLASLVAASAAGGELPNILYILADDLGYGDVGAFNPECKIPTPHLNRLAAEGMVFTDAHSSSAVCTPTRYALLTGRYAWRTRLARGVLGGWSPALIAPGRMTVGELLRSHGYRTGCYGKWHLGLDWPHHKGPAPSDEIQASPKIPQVDYAQPVRGGPRSCGFDTFWGIAASLDMPPFVWIEGERVVRAPTVEKTWIRTGPAAEDFEAEDVMPKLVRRAADDLERWAKDGQRFFAYVAFTAPHTPIVPTAQFRGASKINPYADFVMQTDAAVGELLAALASAGVSESTWVIFTSDNGCSPQANFAELAAHGHRPSYIFRGAKGDIFEGGHRVPFIVRWPGRVAPGTRCHRTIDLCDFLATVAELVGATLPPNAGEDSYSFLRLLDQPAGPPTREFIVHHSIDGTFAIRRGPWKLILGPDSGGWSDPKPGSAAARQLPSRQLYNLDEDPGETHNRIAERPELAKELESRLLEFVQKGRSTPGPAQPNDRDVTVERPRASARR